MIGARLELKVVSSNVSRKFARTVAGDRLIFAARTDRPATSRWRNVKVLPSSTGEHKFVYDVKR